MRSSSYEAPTHDVGGTVMSRPAFGAFAGVRHGVNSVRLKSGPQGKRYSGFLRALREARPMIAAVMLTWLPHAFAQTPAGTTIQNIATVSYGDAVNRSSIASNAVTAVVTPASSTSALSILRAGTMGSGTATQIYATQCQSSNM